MRVHPRLTPTAPQAPSLERDHRNSASLGTFFALNGFTGESRYAPGPGPARHPAQLPTYGARETPPNDGPAPALASQAAAEAGQRHGGEGGAARP
jgi:hypothetical protein